MKPTYLAVKHGFWRSAFIWDKYNRDTKWWIIEINLPVETINHKEWNGLLQISTLEEEKQCVNVKHRKVGDDRAWMEWWQV